MASEFNENGRVKVPALLTLTRLGFEFLSIKPTHENSTQSPKINPKTNIFTEIFAQSISQINPHATPHDIAALLAEIDKRLDYDDLGQSFYEMLISPAAQNSQNYSKNHAENSQNSQIFSQIHAQNSQNSPKIHAQNPIKLIDFENFERNAFHCVTELEFKNGEDSFRPDITLLINGLPLAFVEVKIPNNAGGIAAELARMRSRFANKKFKAFFNALQILVFSNNQPYDEGRNSGAFYATSAKLYSDTAANFAQNSASLGRNFLNKFTENESEFTALLSHLAAQSEQIENAILRDTNLVQIKHTPEFTTNKDPHTPTNRLLISLFSKPRLKMLLKYGICYVSRTEKVQNLGDSANSTQISNENSQFSRATQKHILRYQQFFALQALQNALANGTRRGIIWHTQGSGKTALAFYALRFLRDFFAARNVVAKFYFIVDRIDLKNQAAAEFAARGLHARAVESKAALLAELNGAKSGTANPRGEDEITIINIQQIPADSPIAPSDYAINAQRVYFIDEAHRSYHERGNYFANLMNLDKDAIFISLTGTPLLGSKHKAASRELWGDYIHKYYYNDSIADGYTLRLIREDIETRYKEQLNAIIESIKVRDKELTISEIYAHEKFAAALIEYIIADFSEFRSQNDYTTGAMVVCSSAKQARKFFEIFSEKYAPNSNLNANAAKNSQNSAQNSQNSRKNLRAAQISTKNSRPLTAALILHDSDDKAALKKHIDDFKSGAIDILFVYNMLLTGFDAPRLKKLYLDREIKSHNLLQALTRVNRPYKDFHYGYIVDFAGIEKEFDRVNAAYLAELNKELGDDMRYFSDLFKSKDEIEREIEQIKLAIWDYDTSNLEIFSSDIDAINDKARLIELRKALTLAKELKNAICIQGEREMLARLDFTRLAECLKIIQHRIDTLNYNEMLASKRDISALLNIAMEDIWFKFVKIREHELKLADSLRVELGKTREAINANFDKKDPQWLSLKEALSALFASKNMSEISQNSLNENISTIAKIHAQIAALNAANERLAHKYSGDEKFVRIHKRLLENYPADKVQIHAALSEIKAAADSAILSNEAILDNEEFFASEVKRLVLRHFKGQTTLKISLNDIDFIANLITKEYFNETEAA